MCAVCVQLHVYQWLDVDTDSDRKAAGHHCRMAELLVTRADTQGDIAGPTVDCGPSIIPS